MKNHPRPTLQIPNRTKIEITTTLKKESRMRKFLEKTGTVIQDYPLEGGDYYFMYEGIPINKRDLIYNGAKEVVLNPR